MNGGQILYILGIIRQNQGDDVNAVNEEVRDNTFGLMAENIGIGFGAGQQDAIAELEEQYPQQNNLGM